jgi:hypothetical protein
MLWPLQRYAGSCRLPAKAPRSFVANLMLGHTRGAKKCHILQTNACNRSMHGQIGITLVLSNQCISHADVKN